MLDTYDHFPTRLGRKLDKFPRQDPVIHARHRARWEGPLDETWHAEDGIPRMRAVSASLMLSDNNEFNGPLMLVPGSHQYFVPGVEETPEQNWKNSLKVQRVGVPEREDLQWLAGNYGVTAPKERPGSLLLFECNTLHASSSNMSPWPRSNLFFVYNSVENALAEPFCGLNPRPEFLATCTDIEPLDMLEEAFQPFTAPGGYNHGEM